jgi:glycosyltransferase involved in cell wall biosynthesis
MQKIFLIFHGRFPSNKAASLFAAKSAEAFAKKGIEIILVVPRLLGREKDDPYNYYGIERDFRIVFLPVIDLGTVRFFRRLRFLTSFLSFSFVSFFYLAMRASRKDVIYSNEHLPLFLASFIFPKTFYEMHDFPEKRIRIFSVFLRRMRWVLIHNRWKAVRAKELFLLDEAKIICEPNAVEIDKFNAPLTMEEARSRLSLPRDKKLVIYTGHLYGWKGVAVLAEAAGYLPENYLVFFVGGTAEDVERFREIYSANPRIMIAGFRPHEEIPLWQKSADVLVLPNTAKENISKYYTSPMKLFEYSASARPIVASRIPSITELVDERTALLVEPDNSKALAEGIRRVCEDEKLALSLSRAAYAWVSEHTWQKRAERILRFAGI